MFHSFEEFLEQADIDDKQLTITGDLKCYLLEQERGTCTAKLLYIFDIYLLKQHIQSPTTITARSQSLIDVIITSIDDNKTIDSGVIDLGISDHNLVYLCRKVSIPKEMPKIIFSRQFKNFNVNQFKEDLRNNINTNIITHDPNILWCDWKTKFLNIAEKHAPMRQRRVKSDYTPWLTDKIKTFCYQRDSLKKQAVKFKSAAYDSAYKRHKNYVNRLIKATKEDYF